MRVKVDFTGGEDFTPLPAGVYSVQVVETEVRDSQTSEHPYVNWTLEVVEGEYTGRKLWLVTSLSPRATWKLRETLEALGAGEELDGEVEFDPDEFLGVEVVATVSTEQYQGRLTNRVDAIQRLSQPQTRASASSAKKSATRQKVR